MTDVKDIQHLIEKGCFSELDIHFAKLMTRLSEHELPGLFLAAALVSRATSEGHVCLDLSSLEGKPLMDDDPDLLSITCPNLSQWSEILISSSVVGRPGDYRPLILDDRSRLYLYRYWDYEKKLADDLKARSAAEVNTHDSQLLKDRLSRLFSGDSADWQKVAALVSVMKRFCVISGGPGTGKSTVIAKILALIMEQTNDCNKMRVALATPTGKAAARLQEAIKNTKEGLPVDNQVKEAIVPEASTIHRLLGAIPGSPYFRHNAENLLPVDLVVIDEASMVDLALMSKLACAIPPDARLILLGDKDQLASVQAGAVLGDICNRGRMHEFSHKFSEILGKITGNRITISQDANGSALQDCVVQLQKSYRFGTHSGIGKLSRAVNRGEGDLALSHLKDSMYQDIGWKPLPEANALYWQLREKIVQGYKPYLTAEDPIDIFNLHEQFRILCALRKGPYGVGALNLLVEKILKDDNLINPNRTWYKGRPVLITHNDYELGLFNGDIGIILPDPASNNELRALFLSADGTLRKFLPFRLPEHETVYAMTVHKSQGSEFDNALLLLPDRYAPVLTRELIYTGITRAKRSIEVWATEPVFLEGVHQQTLRASGLRDALWET